MNGQSTVGAFFAGRDIVDIVIVADGRVPPTRITPFPAKRARERGCPVRCARSLRESAPTASLHIVGQSTVGAFFAGRDIANIVIVADGRVPPTRIAPLPAKRARERGCPVRCARSLRESAPTAADDRASRAAGDDVRWPSPRGAEPCRNRDVGAFSAGLDRDTDPAPVEALHSESGCGCPPAERAHERGSSVLDCRVASLLAMTANGRHREARQRRGTHSPRANGNCAQAQARRARPRDGPSNPDVDPWYARQAATPIRSGARP